MKEWKLARLTWPEVKDLLPDTQAVLIPVGATEQHGRHMPLDNDYATSEALCEKIAVHAQEKGMRVLVTPAVNFGASWYHMDFPGTISLTQSTFMNVIKEVCRSLDKHGFKNILMFNSHGGNSYALSVALTELYAESKIKVGLCQWWALSAGALQEKGVQTPLIHAEEAETSLALALGQRVRTEELVRTSFDRQKTLADKGVPTSGHISYDMLKPGSGVIFPMDFIEDISNTGVVGDATRAQKATGEAMVKDIVSKVVELIRDLNA